MMMIANEVKIIPSNETSEDGFKIAKIIIDGKESRIDSFKTEGLVSFDFECDGGFRIWNMRREGLEVVFRDSLNVHIRAL